jgi:iron complex outermembrane receptor protein
MSTKKLALYAAAVGLTLPALPVQAQQEEIIVTARKRQESILKVPVVESVISTQALDKQAIVTVNDISNHVPGLVIGSATGIIGANVAIRGIGTSGTNPIVDQDVLLSIDGMPLTQGLAYTAGTFDLGQVEVLKGPQSLFYGKNSPAGVISLRSADPTDKAEIVLRTGYETVAEQKIGEVVVSGTVAPTLKLRLAAHFDQMNGWMKNLGVGDPAYGGLAPAFTNFAPDKNWIVRGTVLFEPNDRYTAKLKMTWAQRRMHGGGDLQVA